MIRQQTLKLTAMATAVILIGGTWALVRAQAPGNQRAIEVVPGHPGAVVRTVPNLPGSSPNNVGRDGWAAYSVQSFVPAENDPEMAKLAETEGELAHNADQVLSQYVAADKPEDQKRLKSELREALAKQFDVQRQRRELELKRIEERVQKLRDQIKKRNDARETIIDRRLDQLTNEAEGLGWGQPAANPNVRPPVNFYRETKPLAPSEKR